MKITQRSNLKRLKQRRNMRCICSKAYRHQNHLKRHMYHKYPGCDANRDTEVAINVVEFLTLTGTSRNTEIAHTESSTAMTATNNHSSKAADLNSRAGNHNDVASPLISDHNLENTQAE